MKYSKTSWVCPVCKNKNPPSALYCGKCGAKKEFSDETRSRNILIPICIAAVLLVGVIVCVLFSAFGSENGNRTEAVQRQSTNSTGTAGSPQAGKKQAAQNADALFNAFLKSHPEYAYAARLDLDGDGTEEMLVSEGKDDSIAYLCAVSQDGKRVVTWGLSSRFGDFRYDADAKSLAISSSGTGAREYCFLKHRGDTIEVRHVGYTSDSVNEALFAYTETISGGDSAYVDYTFGLVEDEYTWELDLAFLSSHKISVEEYDRWEKHYNSLPVIMRRPVQ